MTEEKKYFTYIDTVTGNKDMEKIIIDGVNVAKCKYYHYKGCTANNFGKCDSCSEIYKNCYYKQLQRLKLENEKLKKEKERLKTLFQNEGITDICECCSIASAMEAYDYHKALKEIGAILSKYISDSMVCPIPVSDVKNIKAQINEVLNEQNN